MDAINDINAINVINNMINDQVPRRRKVYKVRFDPFTLLDIEFKKKYRFTKATICYIVELVAEELTLDSRGSGTSPTLQVLIAIRCWGRREVSNFQFYIHTHISETIY